jgi:hypothetical protein
MSNHARSRFRFFFLVAIAVAGGSALFHRAKAGGVLKEHRDALEEIKSE